MNKLQPTVDLGYPTEARGKIPSFANIEEEAEFWDTHDSTDYLDDVSGKYPSYVSLPGGSGGLAAALSDRSSEISGAERSGKPGRQRGESPQKDQYLFAGITLSYTIMPLRCPTVSHKSTYK